MDFVSGIVHKVNDVEQASLLLCDHFGFVVPEGNTSQVHSLTNGVITIHLQASDHRTIPPFCLDYSVSDLEKAQEDLTTIGFQKTSEIEIITQYRHQLLLHGPYGIDVMIYQIFDEDDLGIHIDLDTNLQWSDMAIEKSRILLKDIPIDFRGNARKKIVKEAEALAITDGASIVEIETAMMAFVRVTPDFKHERLFEKMNEEGFDPETAFDKYK